VACIELFLVWISEFKSEFYHIKKVFMLRFLTGKLVMSSKKKGAPLPASSAGLLRFFEDETKGFKVDPKIVVTVPSALIVVSWLMDILLIP
jgi:preprotein translocase subunit Sec61beta